MHPIIFYHVDVCIQLRIHIEMWNKICLDPIWFFRQLERFHWTIIWFLFNLFSYNFIKATYKLGWIQEVGQSHEIDQPWASTQMSLSAFACWVRDQLPITKYWLCAAARVVHCSFLSNFDKATTFCCLFFSCQR